MATSANTTVNIVADLNPVTNEIVARCSWNALGISVGALWAFYIFCCGITAIFGWGTDFVKLFASLYLGYAASFWGAVIGAIWGFVDGYVAGAAIGWLYNRLAK